MGTASAWVPSLHLGWTSKNTRRLSVNVGSEISRRSWDHEARVWLRWSGVRITNVAEVLADSPARGKGSPAETQELWVADSPCSSLNTAPESWTQEQRVLCEWEARERERAFQSLGVAP